MARRRQNYNRRIDEPPSAPNARRRGHIRARRGRSGKVGFYEGMPTKEFDKLYTCSSITPHRTKPNTTIRKNCKSVWNEQDENMYEDMHYEIECNGACTGAPQPSMGTWGCFNSPINPNCQEVSPTAGAYETQGECEANCVGNVLTTEEQACADNYSLCFNSGQALRVLCILATGYEAGGGCIDDFVSCNNQNTNIGVTCQQSGGNITYIAENEWTVGYTTSQPWESTFPNIPWDDAYDYSHPDNYHADCIDITWDHYHPSDTNQHDDYPPYPADNAWHGSYNVSGDWHIHTCDWYTSAAGMAEDRCGQWGNNVWEVADGGSGLSANEACCGCGGGHTGIGCTSNDDCLHNLECLNPIPLTNPQNIGIIFGNSSCTSNDYSCVCGMGSCNLYNSNYWSLFEPAMNLDSNTCMEGPGTHDDSNNGYDQTGTRAGGFQNDTSTSSRYYKLVPDYKEFRNPKYDDIYSDFISCRDDICQKPANVGDGCTTDTDCYDNDYWVYDWSECTGENPVGTGGDSSCRCQNVATGTLTNIFTSGGCGLLIGSGNPGAEEDCRQMCMNMNSCHINSAGNCINSPYGEGGYVSWQTEIRKSTDWWYHAMYCNDSSNTCEVQDVVV